MHDEPCLACSRIVQKGKGETLNTLQWNFLQPSAQYAGSYYMS